MAYPTADLIRSLAAVHTDTTSAITCYFDLDPDVVPHATALATHLTSVVTEARRAAEDTLDAGHERVRQLREDVDRIASFLDDDFDRAGAHGIGLFVSGAEDVWHEVRLPGQVDDRVEIGRSFTLAPLVPFLERNRLVVVVAVGRDRGSVWRVRGGRELDDEDLSRDGQSQHDQGGWSQARYARARDKEALDHLREVAESVAERVRPGSDALVVVACLEEQRPMFEEVLEPHVQDAVIGWLEFEAHADLPELLPGVEELVIEHIRLEHETLLGRWREERGQLSGLASDTWEETLAAAVDGRIETALVDGRTRSAFECPSCGRAYVQDGLCPLDSTRLEIPPASALEVVIRGTLLNGGDVRMIDELPEAEVAALLRYAQPPA